MGDELFVPEDFVVPDGLIARDFRLAPLGRVRSADLICVAPYERTGRLQTLVTDSVNRR
jgi:hypothetical protein